ncbi:MAG: GAF domain-containing protein [Chloroflexi bacterium]|nr:GAF domain-containing protein [Chloroflexota bacterium]
MSNTISPPKKKSGARPIYLILFIILITLVAIFVNAAIRRSLDTNEKTIQTIRHLSSQAYKLSALEWQIIGEGTTTPEIMEDIETTQQEIQAALAELEVQDPENIQPIQTAYSAYFSAISEEIELISEGQQEAAMELDEEKTDPAFEKLVEAISSTHSIYDARLTQIKQQSNLGFNFLLLSIIAIMTVAFWQFQRTQISVEREHLDQLNDINLKLESNQSLLEQRVIERTRELESRVSQMEIIATIARSITTMQDLEQLLPFICQAVSQQFDIYHTGIFLLDERNEYAALRAANSEGGKRMLARGHRLRVGISGIVGMTAAQGEARIALDVGTDAVYFNNPDLPDTRSEMSLPLKIGGQTIGVLDVQSREKDAFNQEDIAVLGILANQISVAIENTRLFSKTRQALAEAQAIYQQYVANDWAYFGRTAKRNGYTYDGLSITPLENQSIIPAIGSVNLPIKIRGLTIGNVILQSPNPSRQWSQDEVNLAQAAAERAGLAIENYRLLTEAQRRAAKERTIGEITGRIVASVNVREIMQTAVEELGRALPGAEIVLQLQEQKSNDN